MLDEHHLSRRSFVSDSLVAADDAPEWEKELAAELQEYEIVVDHGGLDDELEQEILKEIGEGK